MGVPVLHRVVIGRQCSWFPVDVTEKTKNVGHIVRVLVPLWSRMIRGFWAERLSCGVGVIFRLFPVCLLEDGVGCKGCMKVYSTFLGECLNAQMS